MLLRSFIRGLYVYIHGINTVYTWCIYSKHTIYVVYTWYKHGTYVVYTWCIHGVYVVYVWYICVSTEYMPCLNTIYAQVYMC